MLKTLAVLFLLLGLVGFATVTAGTDESDDIEIIMSDMPLTKTAAEPEMIQVVCVNEQIANTLAAAAAESNEQGAATLLTLMLIGACAIEEGGIPSRKPEEGLRI